MAQKDKSIASGIEISNRDQDETWVIKSIVDNANTTPSSNPRIPRLPPVVKETRDYQKYYVPKVVSIGPYHHGDSKLKFVENLKPTFTMKLLSESSDTLKSLYEILGEPTMVKKLRDFYEEKSTDDFPDTEFTKMMILDGCFILYYIKSIYSGKVESTCELNSHQIVFVHQDLFLLENQIPFQVLTEVMKLKNIEWHQRFEWGEKIKPFIYENFLTSIRQKPGWFWSRTSQIPNGKRFGEEEEDYFRVDHLLQFLHHTLLPREHLVSSSNSKRRHWYHRTETIYLNRCTFRNVSELIEVGIDFKPSNVTHLTQISFFQRWWWFSADVELPPITVDDSTKHILLNLIAHEMCSDVDGPEAWVTSYVCLLDSLIDHPEDVKVLRKAGVLDNSLGSDEEVVKLFKEIGTDLVPNIAAYSEAKDKIQEHYDSLRNTTYHLLKQEYLKGALLGTVMGFVFGIAQTFFSVWNPKGECDDLCKFLKKNHHL